jgi:hypothetical protein
MIRSQLAPNRDQLRNRPDDEAFAVKKLIEPARAIK